MYEYKFPFRLFLAALMLMILCGALAGSSIMNGFSRAMPMAERTKEFQYLTYASPDGKVQFGYYMLAPDIEPGQSYVLILVLHSRSGYAYGAYRLAEQIRNLDMPAFVIVPIMDESVNQWTAGIYRDADPAHPAPIDHAALLTRSVIGNFPIDPARVYVTGYSMGGIGTFAALSRYPNLFAAGIAICGGWPSGDAKAFIHKPLWAFHGAADKVIPVSQTRNVIEEIRKEGGSPRYTEYAGVGHDSWPLAYAEPDLWTWLLSQRLPPPIQENTFVNGINETTLQPEQ